MRTQKGFTLIELMVTIAILAILAAIAYPSYIDYIRKGRLEDARATILDNKKLMERYYGAARTFECRAPYAMNVGVVCDGKAITANTSNSKVNKYYDFKVQLTNNGSNYIITATPKDGVYSSKTLENEQLHLIYHSGSESYAKCTSSGTSNSLKDDKKMTTIEGCVAL